MKFRQYLIVCWHGCVAGLTFVQARSVAQVQEQDSPLRLAKLVGCCALAMAATLVRPWVGSAMGQRGHRLEARPLGDGEGSQGLNAMSRVCPARLAALTENNFNLISCERDASLRRILLQPCRWSSGGGCVCFDMQPWLLAGTISPFGTVVACWRRIIQFSRTILKNNAGDKRIVRNF